MIFLQCTLSRKFALFPPFFQSCTFLHASLIHIPNRTFLVRFGGISGEFGRAMVRILARRSRAKLPMARPNEPDMPPKRTKKVRLGIYRTQIPTPLFQSDCLSTCRRSWQASSSLVLAGKIFAPSFDSKTSAKS